MWNAFRNCRKACEWRYVKELVPLSRDHKLSFGTLIHECLEIWHRDGRLRDVLDHIDGAMPDRGFDQSQKADWHLATAMMKGYAARYVSEEFDVVALEKTFESRITNPATNTRKARATSPPSQWAAWGMRLSGSPVAPFHRRSR
jgi:hypothetical protein